MGTITEDYVSFETAKLLKEKGFDGVLPFIYVDTEKSDREVHLTDTLCNYNDDHIKDVISAPTHQMAMRWLRESHNLYIEPYVVKNYNDNKLEYTYSIQDLDFNGSDDGIDCCKDWNSPEEACEAAIKYCLENLI